MSCTCTYEMTVFSFPPRHCAECRASESSEMTTNFTTRMTAALNAERVCTAPDAWVARAERRAGGRT